MTFERLDVSPADESIIVVYAQFANLVLYINTKKSPHIRAVDGPFNYDFGVYPKNLAEFSKDGNWVIISKGVYGPSCAYSFYWFFDIEQDRLLKQPGHSGHLSNIYFFEDRSAIYKLLVIPEEDEDIYAEYYLVTTEFERKKYMNISVIPWVDEKEDKNYHSYFGSVLTFKLADAEGKVVTEKIYLATQKSSMYYTESLVGGFLGGENLLVTNVIAQKMYIGQVAKEQISMMRAKYSDCPAN